MQRVNVEQLVKDIKAAEEAKRSGKWKEYAQQKRTVPWVSGWTDWYYEKYVTGLYTLRAFLRGKMHRQNPPEPIRGFHQSMIQLGERDPDSKPIWDMHEHNENLANKVAEIYVLDEAAA